MARGTADLEAAIVEFLGSGDYKPMKAPALAKCLRVTKSALADFRAALERLVATDRVREARNGLLRLRAATGLIEGTVKRTATGAGYVIPLEALPDGARDDVYVDRRDMKDAHTGDQVLVQLIERQRSGGQRCGRIAEVLIRSTRTFVGTYFERDGQGFVQIDGRTVTDPISVGDPGAKGAQVGDKVVIEMLRFPSHQQPGEGVLTQVLGPRGEPGVDTLSIVHEFGIPVDFPEDALEEARLQTDRFDEEDLGDRLDLTQETIVTIDPVDARDFDDAISLSKSEDGHWHLGVHIADVAAFVVEGSALDDAARLRGTSVYLPQRVIPMLPETISNGLASLQQGRVRYTLSALMEFSSEGTPIHTRLAKSAIKATRRFAYEQVMPILRDPEAHRTTVSAKVRGLLGRMYEFAMILRKRRFAAGALNLELAEVDLDFDADGRVTGAHETVHDESHQIIEEFMLAANVAVATKLNDRRLNFLRRAHASPDLVKSQSLATFVAALGFPLKRPQSRTELQGLIARVRGTPVERAVNFALLRSMKQAEYTPLPIGHYALAVEQYCHFTSPIRRYPDLTVHRLVRELVESPDDPRSPDEVELLKLGKHCSVTERRAESAERELIKVKLLTFLVDKIGLEMDASITGVEPFGIFCQGRELPVDGLVHVSAISANDYVDYDAATFSFTSRRTGRQYRLGDTVRVKVAHVDVDRRSLDFALVVPTSSSAATSKSRPPRDVETAEPAASRRPKSGRAALRDASESGGRRQGKASNKGPKPKTGGKKQGRKRKK